MLKQFFLLLAALTLPSSELWYDKTFSCTHLFSASKELRQMFTVFLGFKKECSSLIFLGCWTCVIIVNWNAFSHMWQICKTRRRPNTDTRTTTCEVHQLITVASAAPLLAGHTRAYDTIEKTRLITIAWHANKGRIILFTAQFNADTYQQRHDILCVYSNQTYNNSFFKLLLNR